MQAEVYELRRMLGVANAELQLHHSERQAMIRMVADLRSQLEANGMQPNHPQIRDEMPPTP